MADLDNAPVIISRKAAKLAGLKRYYTGIPCKRGHIAERYIGKSSCVECLRIKKKIRSYETPEQKKIRFKSWYDRNKEARAKQKAEERKANPELLRLRYKRWATANPEHVLANARRRWARKKNAEGRHTGAEIRALFKRQRGKCADCATSLKPGYHVDHIIPLSKGGTNWIANIQLLCPTCNQHKSAKDPLRWAQELGRLL